MEQKKIAAGLLAICPETERFLILKRSSHVVYPNYWAPPGGSFEECDKYPKMTAVREFREETGYCGVMKVSKEPLDIYDTNHISFYTYVCILPNEFAPNLKGEAECGLESSDYAWTTIDCFDKVKDSILIIPSFLDIIENKRGLLNKVINKFKNKNYE